MKNWIGSIKMDKGAFTKKAQAAGMSVAAYASRVKKNPSKFSTRTERQANLARTLRRLSK